MRVLLVVLFGLLLYSCSRKPDENWHLLKLVDSNRALQILGFDKAVINDIARDTDTAVWQGLLPVYKMPADTDMKDFQKPQPGKYAVQDSMVVFTPDTAFKKGQSYFVRCFDYQGVKDAWHILGDKKRLGAATHRDLSFSY